MAIQPINTLKAWFLTALKPTQQQFHDWMDSYWHKSETIPTNKIDGLDAILATVITQTVIDNTVKNETVITSSSPHTYNIPAGRLLDQIVVESATAQNLTIETGTGLKDIADADAVLANGFLTYVVNQYAKGAVKPIYFIFSNEITIKLYLR